MAGVTMPPFASMHPQPAHGGVPGTHQPIRSHAQPLRRAVYIHVSDLINAYNIDHTKLEEELDRVKAERDGLENAPKIQQISSGSGSYRHGTTVVSGSSGGSQSSRGGIPTELEARDPQKRLQPPRGGHNMVVLVGRVKVVVDKHRVDGSRVRLAEVEVGDETGIVSLRARDEQIDIVQSLANKEGAIVLRNCTLELYQGKHIRLAITKWGKLSRYPDNVASTPPPPSKLNRDRNFSLIDLSMVASEMATFPSLSMQSTTESQHQSNTYSRQSSHGHDSEVYQKQSSQHLQQRNKPGRKQPRGKQISHGGPSNISPSMPYQVIDHGSSAGGPLRYNPHTLSTTSQTAIHPTPYSASSGYTNHPQHQGVTSTVVHHPPMQQHFQYHQPRSIPDTIPVGHPQHHPQQLLFQHQYEMQQRHIQQMYQTDNRVARRQQPQVPQQQGGPAYHVAPSYIQGAPRPTPGQVRQFASQHPQTYQQYQRHPSSISPPIQPTNAEDPGSPGKMNPKAASFDPAANIHRTPSR